jgi:DNA polymerase elongation subunit (family B)
VAKIQRSILEILAKETDLLKLPNLLPEVLRFIREQLDLLKSRSVPLEELVVTQTLSRELDGYSVLSPLASAARQLQVHGKSVRMGQRIQFIYIAPAPGVRAWGLPTQPDPRIIDVPRYQELIVRAIHEIVQPLDVTEKILRDWLFSKAGYITPPGQLGSTDPIRLELPLFNNLKHVRVDTF